MHYDAFIMQHNPPVRWHPQPGSIIRLWSSNCSTRSQFIGFRMVECSTQNIRAVECPAWSVDWSVDWLNILRGLAAGQLTGQLTCPFSCVAWWLVS